MKIGAIDFNDLVLEDYHPKWSLIVRLIRKRSGNKCEGTPKHPHCKAVNGQPHPDTKSMVVLTTAHMDQNKDNNSFDNLRHLCQRCHLDWDRNQHIRNRKYGRYHKRNQFSLFS